MTPDDRERWNDARLDDFYEEFRRMVVMVEQVPVLSSTLARVAEDATMCRKNVHNLRQDFAAEALARANREQEDAKRKAVDRKSDRRWLIGTCLTTAALVIAAVGLLLSYL